MARSRGQASVNLALALREAEQNIQNQLFKSQQASKKKQSRSGLGRLLGGLVGGLLLNAIVPGAGFLLTGLVSAGAGRLGSEVGERTVEGKKIGKQKFHRDRVKALNRQLREQQREFNKSQNLSMLSDFLSAGLQAGTFAKGGRLLKEAPHALQTASATGTSPLQALAQLAKGIGATTSKPGLFPSQSGIEALSGIKSDTMQSLQNLLSGD